MDNYQVATARVFHALACPTRLSMVEHLMRGPASVSTLAAPLNIALPTVMKHIEVLRESGLVRSEKTGRVRTCHLQPEAFATAELWIARQRAIWDARFDRLEAYLQEIEGKDEN